MDRRCRTFWVAIALLALPLAMFWQVWHPNPERRQAFAYGDFVEQYYPMRVFVSGEWREGRLPLWDPYTYGGQPAAAASLSAAYYPLGAWLALFPHPFPIEALELEALLHLGLAGFFTFLFIRQVTGSYEAGLVSGLAFSLGGFLTSYPLLQLGILETAVWLPAGLWLIELGLSRRSLTMIAFVGVALGCAALAGHPQTFLYLAYTAGAYLLFRMWRLRFSGRQVVATLAVLGSVVAGISAVQWLPSYELARLSPRARLSYEEASNGFALAEWWGLLRPNPGQWSPLYVGLIPVALAAFGLILAASRFARRPSESGRAAARDDAGEWAEIWFWLAVVGVALLLSLGRNGFLYRVAYIAAPGFALFRNQERAAFLVSFGLAVLAGYGAAALKITLGTGRGRWPGLRYVWLLLALLIVLDLYHARSGLVLQAAPREGYFPSSAMVQHLQTTGGPDWRTSSEGLLPGDGNAGLVYRIRDVTGNSPLHLALYDRFLAELPETRVWQLLNVQHLLTRRKLDHGALKLVLGPDGEGNRLYQVFVSGVPAWIVHKYREASDLGSALRQTADPALDPRETAILEARPDLEPGLPPGDAGEDRVKLLRFSPQQIVLDVLLSAPGILVTSEPDYPGWEARVIPGGRTLETSSVGETPPSGEEAQEILPLGTGPRLGRRAETLRAYGLLRAIALPAGSWRVEWYFESQSARVGLAASLMTLVLVAIAAAVGKSRRDATADHDGAIWGGGHAANRKG